MNRLFVIIASVFALAALTPAAAIAAEQNHAAHAVGAELTLIDIMQDLSSQMSRIQQGLFIGNRLMIEQGALAIALHPKPEGGIKPYLQKNADQIKAKIPELDHRIHVTAKAVAEMAKTAPINELAAKVNSIVDACVACHAMFRDGA